MVCGSLDPCQGRIMSDMVWLLQAVYSTVLCATVVLTAMGVATATTDATIIKQLNETIAKVQTSENPNSRSDAAEHLAQLTRKVDPKEVDDKTLADLVSLLDTWEDSVRDSVAISLGNLGPRARVAAPALLEILPEVDCLWVDASSAHDVRNALKRIGVTPPPPPTCETTVDPVVWNQRMRETIAKAAAHLRYLTFWLGAKGIDDKNIADLVSLLDTPEEPVREAVVGSLGYIG